MQDYFMLVIQHLSSLFIDIRAEKVFRTRHNCGVGAFLSFATRADRADEVVVPVAFPQVDSFVSVASDLALGVKFRRDHHIICHIQFHDINSEEAPPKHIILAVFLIEILVDGVLYIHFTAVKYFAFRCERTFGRIGNGITNGANPMIAPLRQRIEKNIFAFHIANLRGPKMSTFFDILVVGQEVWTSLISEGSSYLFPFHHIS